MVNYIVYLTQFSFCFTETLYQESGGEYAVMSNEDSQMEVQLETIINVYPIISCYPIINV